MTRIMLAIVCCLGAADSGDDTVILERVNKAANEGRYGDAERFARDSIHPLAKSYRAIVIRTDSVALRLRGVTAFDTKLSDQLVRESLPYLQMHATDDVRCASRLGTLHFWGTGVTKDDNTAFKWWSYAASKHSAPAMMSLGVCCQEGRGGTKDLKKAFSWMKKASEAGELHATVLLGDYHRDGTGTEKNGPASFALYEKAANSGSLEGIMRCADIAQERVDRSLKNGDSASAIRYYKIKEHWLMTAAERGDGMARISLGTLWRVGFGAEILPDPDASFREFKGAANSGVSYTVCYLACCYLKGWGCTANPHRAEVLLRQAAIAAERESDMETLGVLKRILTMTEGERSAALGEWLDWGPESKD